eukprot:UN00101
MKSPNTQELQKRAIELYKKCRRMPKNVLERLNRRLSTIAGNIHKNKINMNKNDTKTLYEKLKVGTTEHTILY